MQPTPITLIMQLAITAGAICVAVAAIALAFPAAKRDSNAALVTIGVGVLRADPGRDDAQAAREWALDLIDANTGGVKFSAQARTELLRKPLGYFDGSDVGDDQGGVTDAAPPTATPPKRPASK